VIILLAFAWLFYPLFYCNLCKSNHLFIRVG